MIANAEEEYEKQKTDFASFEEFLTAQSWVQCPVCRRVVCREDIDKKSGNCFSCEEEE